MIRQACTHRLDVPPPWAILERRLLDDLDGAVQPFVDRYAEPDGTFHWCGRLNGLDSADDFYEPFGNWPLLYLLGGGDHVLELAKRQWRAVTTQLDRLGAIERGFIRYGDWFHNSEAYVYFYLLCLADPEDQDLRALARSFAELYMGDDPGAPNFDPVRTLIRSPLTGGGGPHFGYLAGDGVYSWRAGMVPYGLPYLDVDGVTSYDDLRDPEKAARMGHAMQDRMSRGDVAQNLAVTGLVANAFLLFGERRYHDWILAYVGSWRERASQNGGLLPDNVGPTGEVGESLGGRWYGSAYGWTWPHGFYNLQSAATVAATSATLVDADQAHLDLARTQLERVTDLGTVRPLGGLSMSLGHHFVGPTSQLGTDTPTFVVPFRHGDAGWFDEHPLTPMHAVAIWNASETPADWQRITALQELSGYDWRVVVPSRTKEDAGHEAPWIAYLEGDNPGYPEAILGQAIQLVAAQLERVAADTTDLTTLRDDEIDRMAHHWQTHNPVTTEALVQLTLGAPQIVYNGGLLVAPIRYFDHERRRPGLPPGVAALVEARGEGWIRVALVNLDAHSVRETVIAAGALGERRFTSIECLAGQTAADGLGSDATPCSGADSGSDGPAERWVTVRLPPKTWTRLELRYERHAEPASVVLPWSANAT